VKSSSNILNLNLAISCVLFLAIAHIGVLIPNSNTEGLFGLANGSSTTTLSGKDNIFDSILISVCHEHVFLIANSNTAFLRLSISSSCLHQSSMLIAISFLG